MAVKTPNNPINGRYLLAIVAGAIGAVGSAGGTTYVFLSGLAPSQMETMARPDPFRGSEGDALKRQLNNLQRQVDQLPPRALTEEIALLRREIEFIRDEIERHHP